MERASGNVFLEFLEKTIFQKFLRFDLNMDHVYQYTIQYLI